ncbi:MAG: hypothetical protein IKF14_15420 [Atopobiaceae bacterium]|nr:hypothetical protein [Atopobiaceae bacterium]
MFTQAEKSPIYTKYFTLLSDGVSHAEIRSIDTRDTWIVRPENGLIATYHKPRKARRYHHQCNSATVASAVKKIRKHDAWKMRTRYGVWVSRS